jgi:hypothetical protein
MSYLQRKELFGYFCVLTKVARRKALALRNAFDFKRKHSPSPQPSPTRKKIKGQRQDPRITLSLPHEVPWLRDDKTKHRDHVDCSQ